MQRDMLKVSTLFIFFAASLLAIFLSSDNVFADENTNHDDLQSRIDSTTKWANTPIILIYNIREWEPQYPFVEFREGQVTWFDRLVKERMIFAGNLEISQYLEMVGHNDISVRYVTADENPPKYYSIRLVDPGLSLDEHYIRANFIYYEPDDFTTIDIDDDDDIPRYLKHAFEENDWTVLSDDEYLEFKEYVSKNGIHYEISSNDSRSEYYKLAYIGPESEEVKQGNLRNNLQKLNITESQFDIAKKDNCSPTSSHNDANDFLPYSERFSVTDKTGEQIYIISYGDTITARYNPYNDWAEVTPFVFEFAIMYHDGDRWFTIHTEKKTINKPSLCDVEKGFEWNFTPNVPGTYEMSIDRINSEYGSEFERRITVEKNNISNSLRDDPRFLQNLGSDGFLY